MQGGALLAHGSRGRQTFVAEEINFRLQKAAGVVQVLNLETIRSLAKDVQPSVGILFQNAHDLGGAADHGQPFALRTNHAEANFLRQANAHHLLITVFENMERQRCFGKQHYLQRKQGYLHSLAIMLALGAPRPIVKVLVLMASAITPAPSAAPPSHSTRDGCRSVARWQCLVRGAPLPHPCGWPSPVSAPP